MLRILTKMENLIPEKYTGTHAGEVASSAKSQRSHEAGDWGQVGDISQLPDLSNHPLALV